MISLIKALKFRIALLDYKYGKYTSYNEWAKKWGFDLEDLIDILN
jgi:hypothetical protein